jgi:hypothetical protein
MIASKKNNARLYLPWPVVSAFGASGGCYPAEVRPGRRETPLAPIARLDGGCLQRSARFSHPHGDLMNGKSFGGGRPLVPRICNIALDSNALDRDGSANDELVSRFREMTEAGQLTVDIAGGARDEVQHRERNVNACLDSSRQRQAHHTRGPTLRICPRRAAAHPRKCDIGSLTPRGPFGSHLTRRSKPVGSTASSRP